MGEVVYDGDSQSVRFVAEVVLFIKACATNRDHEEVIASFEKFVAVPQAFAENQGMMKVSDERAR